MSHEPWRDSDDDVVSIPLSLRPAWAIESDGQVREVLLIAALWDPDTGASWYLVAPVNGPAVLSRVAARSVLLTEHAMQVRTREIRQRRAAEAST